MHINRSVLSRQHRIQRYAVASDAFRFFNLLTSPELLNRLESSLPEHRERLFPPTETLSMFLAQALQPDRSCQNIVNDAAVKRLTYRLPKCSTNTGGYCKARQRLPLEMISGMVHQTGRLIAAKASELAYNLIRLIMAQSALMADVLPRTLSFKHTLQLWLAWSGIQKQTNDKDDIDKLLMLVVDQSIGNRPGRIEPRAIKRRPKPYPLLTKARALAREQVKK